MSRLTNEQANNVQQAQDLRSMTAGQYGMDAQAGLNESRSNRPVPCDEICDSDGQEERPQMIESDPSENKIRNSFKIEQLNYGYIITVGCHKFAIETHQKVTKMIGEYLADPNGTERKWYANELELKRH